MTGAGTEKALRQIIAEEAPVVRAMVKGEIPTNDLYLVRAIDDLHRIQITADKLALQALKERAEVAA